MYLTFTYDKNTSCVDDKGYAKILEWIEMIAKDIREIKALLHDHSQKIETLYEVVQEMRDDMRFIKRTINAHDEEIAQLRRQAQELAKSIHT